MFCCQACRARRYINTIGRDAGINEARRPTVADDSLFEEAKRNNVYIIGSDSSDDEEQLSRSAIHHGRQEHTTIELHNRRA